MSLVVGGTEQVWQSSPCASRLSFVCERSAPFISLDSNHAYKLRTAAVSFEEARERCKAEGGRLAALETAEERAFVGSRVNLEVWVDAQDTETTGRFVWSTGVEVDLSDFRAGQPDDTDGSQGCLLLSAGDRLSDERCEQTLPFVCELD